MEVNPFRRMVSILDRGHWCSVSEFAHLALYHMKEFETKEIIESAEVDELTLVAEIIAAMKSVGFVEFNPWDKTQIRIVEKWYDTI